MVGGDPPPGRIKAEHRRLDLAQHRRGVGPGGQAGHGDQHVDVGLAGFIGVPVQHGGIGAGREARGGVDRRRPGARPHVLERVLPGRMIQGEGLLSPLADRQRGGQQRQRAQPFRMAGGQHHADDAAEGLAGVMEILRPQAVGDGDEVRHVVLDREALFQVEIPRRLPQAAQVGADHPEEAAEIRDHAPPELGGTRIAVLQDQDRRVLPRIGIVVQVVVQLYAVLGDDFRHGVPPSSWCSA